MARQAKALIQSAAEAELISSDEEEEEEEEEQPKKDCSPHPRLESRPRTSRSRLKGSRSERSRTSLTSALNAGDDKQPADKVTEAVPAAEAEEVDMQSLPTEQIEPGKHVSELMQTVQDPKGFAIAFANGTGPRAQSDLQQHVRTAQSRPVIGLPRATRRPCATQWSGSTKRPYFNVHWLLTVLNLLVLIIRFVALSFKKAFQKVVPRRTNADSRYITSFCVPRRVNYDQQSQAVPFEQIINFYMHDSDSDLLDYCMRQAGPTLEQRVPKRLAAQRVDQRLCNSNIVCELPNEQTADDAQLVREA